MPENPEAPRLNLEYYRKAAKSLMKAALAGDAAARERVARVSPHGPVALHLAQLAIAREQGFASWARFRRFLTESALDFQGLAAKFVDAALDDVRHGEEMLLAVVALARFQVNSAAALIYTEQVVHLVRALFQLPHELRLGS